MYLAQFQIVPASGETCAACAEHAAQAVRERVQGAYRQWLGGGLALGWDGQTRRPRPGDEATATLAEAGSCRVFELSLVCRDRDDFGVRWNLSVKIGGDEQTIWAQVTLARAGGRLFRGVAAPPPMLLSAVFSALLDGFDCRLPGGKPVPDAAHWLQTDDMAAFVARDLLDPARVLPIVAVSPDAETGEPIPDVVALARDLRGLARVVVFADSDAAYALTHAVGDKILSCYNGAARLYWPGFSRDDEPFLHPLLLDGTLWRLEHDRAGAAAELLRMLDEKSRVPDESFFADLRARIAVALAPPPSDKPEAAPVFSDLEARVTALQTENAGLRAQVDSLKTFLGGRMDAMQAETRLWLEEIVGEIGRMGERQTTESQTDARRFRTVSEALTQARTDFDDVLDIWTDAEKSAKLAQYGQPERVYESLSRLAEVGRERFAAHGKNRSLGKGWVEWLREKGEDCADESPTTMNKYSDERRFHDRPTRRETLMTWHLKLGGSNRGNCVRLYFAFDDPTQRVLIGHCGGHLTNTLS